VFAASIFPFWSNARWQIQVLNVVYVGICKVHACKHELLRMHHDACAWCSACDACPRSMSKKHVHTLAYQAYLWYFMCRGSKREFAPRVFPILNWRARSIFSSHISLISHLSSSVCLCVSFNIYAWGHGSVRVWAQLDLDAEGHGHNLICFLCVLLFWRYLDLFVFYASLVKGFSRLLRVSLMRSCIPCLLVWLTHCETEKWHSGLGFRIDTQRCIKDASTHTHTWSSHT